MSAKLDDVTLWQSRIEALEGKIAEAGEQVEIAVAEASTLIVEGAAQSKIERAKKNADEAHTDLAHLERAIEDAGAELVKAETRQTEEIARQRGQRVARLHSQRQKVLRDAQEKFDEALAKLQESEALAVEIHAACSGSRRAQEAVNNRHAGILQWTITRLCAALPIAEGFIGNIAANMNTARQKVGENDLAGTQPDFAAEFSLDQQARLEKAA
jgi:hypothetical protein